MRKAILIVGFNNWGKSTIVYNLFDVKQIRSRNTYEIRDIGVKFAVQVYSNDDWNQNRYITALNEPTKSSAQNLLAAFCPTREPHNDSRVILTSSSLSRYNEIHLFYLRFKWDHHAELRTREIRQYFQGINNLHHFDIDADEHILDDSQRLAARVNQIITRLRLIYS